MGRLSDDYVADEMLMSRAFCKSGRELMVLVSLTNEAGVFDEVEIKLKQFKTYFVL